MHESTFCLLRRGSDSFHGCLLARGSDSFHGISVCGGQLQEDDGDLLSSAHDFLYVHWQGRFLKCKTTLGYSNKTSNYLQLVFLCSFPSLTCSLSLTPKCIIIGPTCICQP